MEVQKCPKCRKAKAKYFSPVVRLVKQNPDENDVVTVEADFDWFQCCSCGALIEIDDEGMKVVGNR